MTTKTRLTILAFAAAVLTSGTALAGTATEFDKIRRPGEVNTQKQLPPAGSNVGSLIKKVPTGELGALQGQQAPAGGTHVGGIISKLPPGELGAIFGQQKSPPPTGLGTIVGKLPPGTITGQLNPPPTGLGSIQPVQACFAGQPCNLNPPKPPVPFPPPSPPGHPCPTWGCNPPPWLTGDGDNDGHHHGDHDGDYGHGYGYGYGWRERPEVVIEGAPAAVTVPAPVLAVPARAPVAAQPVVAQPVVSQEPCSCLSKQTLQDGSILFQDICTKQSALAPAPGVAAQ